MFDLKQDEQVKQQESTFLYVGVIPFSVGGNEIYMKSCRLGCCISVWDPAVCEKMGVSVKFC